MYFDLLAKIPQPLRRSHHTRAFAPPHKLDLTKVPNSFVASYSQLLISSHIFPFVMSPDDAWAHMPRQYRPHAYVPILPQSTSLSNLDSEAYSNPYSAIPTYNRRRTDNNFGYRTPRATAIQYRSHLTASVSSNDINRSPLTQRHRHATLLPNCDD